MYCPNCHSTAIRKYGSQNGKQRYQCKECGRYFMLSYKTCGYPLEIKQLCLTMHFKGIGFRAIERATGIHHTTIMNWVREDREPLHHEDGDLHP